MINKKPLKASNTKIGSWEQAKLIRKGTNPNINSSNFGRNDAEIKEMTKHQDLKNEVRRSWKLKNAKVVPVIAGLKEMMIKNLPEILNTGVVPLGAHLVVAG